MPQISTHYRGNYETEIITLDSKDLFTSTTGSEQCTFKCKLSEQIHLTDYTEIYLESLHIGGYKINENVSAAFDDNDSKDVIRYFSIGVPEFNIRQIGGQYNSDGKNHVTEMHHRFNLAHESSIISNIAGVLQPKDFRPFILGHLSRTAVFVSSLPPCTLSSITVDIKDQDGESIFKELVNPGAHSVDANPPSKSRRIMMQFLLIKKKLN